MKKLAAIILSFVLLLNLIPIGVSAKENFTDYKEAFYAALYNVESIVYLSEYNVTVDEIKDYLKYLVYQHPEIDYFSNKLSGSVFSDGTIDYLTLSYTMSKSEILERREFIDETLNPILEKIKANWTDTQKALYIHDWLVANFMYDYKLYEEPGTENHDIYGFLKDGRGVCQSYAATFMYMARKVGLESYMVVTDGNANASPHGWNVVKIDGNWYHVDTTYDDPILGVSFRYDYVGEVSHDKFLRSDEQILESDENDEHDGFYLPFVDEQIVCNEYTGDDLWRNAVSSVLPVGEYWYYLDPKGANGGLLRTKDFKTAERVAEVGYYVPEWDAYGWKIGSRVKSRYYTGLFEYNEHLFYSDSENIYVYDTHHDELNALPIEREEGNYYFGINMKGKSITYITSRTDIRENVVEGVYALNSHFIVSHWDILKNPTQTEDGLKVKRCYFCGEVVESQTIPMLSQVQLGDIDGSGEVDVSDLAVLKLFLAGAGGSEIANAADIDGSGKVDVSDLAMLKLHLAGAGSIF